MVCLGVRIDTRPNLTVHLLRERAYGDDRFDLHPAQPGRVTVRHVDETQPPAATRGIDGTGLDLGALRWGFGLSPIPPQPEADKSHLRCEGVTLVAVTSDSHLGGIIDVFA